MATVDELMDEVDSHVKRLIETFEFLLKYKILFRGTGIEFAGLKEYAPGQDDASKIDWKASLRTQRLYVKQYEEERDLDIVVALDSSASMVFGTQDKLKSEYASIVAGCLAFAGIETGDNVGFVMFNDKLVEFLEQNQDLAQYYHILSLMVNPDNWGNKCNMSKAIEIMTNNLRSKTALFIISDFIDLDEKWSDALKMAAAKFDRVIGIMIRDVRERYWPTGVGYIRFSSPYENRVKTVNVDKKREEFEKEAEKQEKMIERAFLESKAGFVKIYTNQEFVDPLVKYLEISELI